jgi:hypothetical protein
MDFKCHTFNVVILLKNLCCLNMDFFEKVTSELKSLKFLVNHSFKILIIGFAEKVVLGISTIKIVDI